MAGMADFYLRWGDALSRGIGQMGSAGDHLIAADQRNQQAQNELAQFVERRVQSRNQERRLALEEMEAQRRREAEQKEQERKDAEFQRMAKVIEMLQKGRQIANADPRLAKSTPKPQGPSREEMAWLEDTTGGTLMPPQRVGAADSTALMGRALDQFPGEAAGGTVPYTREEVMDLLTKNGMFDELNKYAGATKPEPDKEADRAFRWAMNEYNQGRMDRRTLMQIGSAMDRAEMSERNKPRAQSGMPLTNLGDTEVKTLKDIRNTAFSINKIREAAESISSLKKGPIAGRLLGKNPYDSELQALDRLVSQTVPSMARGIFGEVGVLTDQDVERYKKMLASVKDQPELAKQLLDEIQEKIESAWRFTVDSYSRANRDVSQFSAGMTFAELAAMPTSQVPAKLTPTGAATPPAGGWSSDKEKRYQELMAKKNAGSLK